MKYPLYCQFWQLFLFNFFIGITQQAYREAVWVGANISWFCWPCQPGSPVPESSRISPVSEQSIDILASSEFNPRAYQSDSSQSTIYDPPAQSTTVRWVKTRHVSLTRKGHCRGRTLSSTYLNLGPHPWWIIHQWTNTRTSNRSICFITFKVIEDSTSKGRPKLIDSRGYSYGIKGRRVYTSDWLSTRRPKVNPCKTSIIEHSASFHLGSNAHNHVAEVGATLAEKIHAV